MEIVSTSATQIRHRKIALVRCYDVGFPFVALVNQRGEFKRLIDRQVVIEQVAAKLGDPTSELVDTTAKKE